MGLRGFLFHHPGLIAWLVLFFMTLGIGSVAYTANQDREKEIEGLVDQAGMQRATLTRTALEERDVNCRLFEELDERDLEDLRALEETVGSGGTVPPYRLQVAERRAERVQAPAYCDRPGMGLPERKKG